MSVKGAALQKDVPWRASTAAKPIPKIHHSPILRLSHNPYSEFALSVMKGRMSRDYGRVVAFTFIYSGYCGKHLVFLDIISQHDDPIGSGLGKEAVVEAAGPDCIVPGQTVPIKLLGLKVPPSPSAFPVWPIEVDLKFMEPVGRELKSIGKFMDSAVDLMNKSFIDR
ncbi:hypothetical protein SASPL_105607 [Salvia splendens]|uniref:Uncharacterized protein n=1 Tax=Salvia splendens TaxID=180675 RepID=A0A8X8YJI1_SALSN|nr:hypothetical protein SASPL_105607 [Salvia splendens]